MSSETLGHVAERMATDAAFRRAVVADPRGTLGAYDLSDEEKQSLLPDTIAWDIELDREHR